MPSGVFHTGISCSDFASIGSSSSGFLAEIDYTVSNGKIGQNVSPGVFFYYTRITTTVANQTVTVFQSNDCGAAPFQTKQTQAYLYSLSCSTLQTGTPTATGGATFIVASPGTYIIGIKYDTKSIAGTTAPVCPTTTYTFSTSAAGSISASVPLIKQ